MLLHSAARVSFVVFVTFHLSIPAFAGNRGVVPQRKKNANNGEPTVPERAYFARSRVKLTTSQDAANYLLEYGYMNERDLRRFESLQRSEATRSIRNKLMRLQITGHLPPTGMLDRKTKYLMDQPRCGNKDTEGKRNNIPLKLNCVPLNGIVSYAVLSYTKDLSQNTVKKEIARAFREWEDVLSVEFQFTNSTGDIEIHFVDRLHTYSPMFDGAGGTVAKAKFATVDKGGQCGTIFVDEGEVWTKQSPLGLDLFTVLVHEIGHLIGLSHSGDPDSIMWPWFDTRTTLEDLKERRRQKLDNVVGRRQLSSTKQGAIRQRDSSAQHDGISIQSINTVQNSQPNIWIDNDSVHRRGPNDENGPQLLNRVTDCPSSIDAITVAANGKTYAFKGNKVYKLNNTTLEIEDGYPRPIAREFGNNAPDHVDAAVTLHYYGVPFTYLFKARQYWRYREGFDGDLYADKDYPRPTVQGWTLHVPHLDAVVEWERNSFLLFFQGNNIYGHDGKEPIEKGKPRHRKDFPQFRALPKQGLLAAMRWHNHRTYFFYEDRYYVWARAVFGQSKMSGPFSTEYDFFNCPNPLIGSGTIN